VRPIVSLGTLLTVLGIVSAVMMAQPQVKMTTSPRFEVASIKACKADMPSDGRSQAASLSPGRLHVVCSTARSLIQMAFDRYGAGTGKSTVGRLIPIEQGPIWIDSDRFSIEAESPDAQSEGTAMGPMLQALLEDRFKLKIHRESRAEPVYLLTVAAKASRLQPFVEGTCTPRDLSEFPPPPPGPGTCRFFRGRKGPNVLWTVQGATIDEFCKIVLSELDRPVIDNTGLKGRFNFPLEYMPEATFGAAGVSDDPAAGPSIFTALQEQFGLKLKESKGPGDRLVIDFIEKPSAN
jgi:uncharacterized protein (TIGR03435 family)